jgi:23S rRNA (guanosine2251-2'-O)-methyltransferase
VLEVLRAQRPVNKVVLDQGVTRDSRIAEALHLAREQRVPVDRVDGATIARLSPTGRSQGILAMVAARAYADLEDLLAVAAERGEALLLAVLDGIEDPQNLGAIIRSADAAGVHGVVVPERRAVGLTAAVGRASAGAIEHVPVARVTSLAKALERLKEAGAWTVGIDAGAPQDFRLVDYRQPTALVIGAEDKGLSRLVRERCDVLAAIPMYGKVASLNASVAAALSMYEVMRQRRAPGE